MNRIDMKYAMAFDKKSNLVFRVSMLLVELVQHFWQSRRIWSDVDDIGREIATCIFQSLNFRSVSIENLLGTRVRVVRNFPLPLFVPYAMWRQIISYCIRIADGLI